MTIRDREHDEWIPWYVEDTPGWLELSLGARGAMEGIARKLNRKTGQLALRRGLSSLAILLHVRWDELEPALAELIAKGKITWDGSLFVLFDPDYLERKRRSGADRMADLRSRRKSTPPPPVTDVTSQASLSSPASHVTDRDGCDSCSSLLSSDLISSDLRSEIASSGVILDRTAPLEPDAGVVFDTIATNRHVGQEPEVAWTNFTGHFAGQHFPSREAVLGRWQKWVSQQAVYSAKERDKDRSREDAAAERKRFAREGPEKPPPQTKAQSEAFAKELRARMGLGKDTGT